MVDLPLSQRIPSRVLLVLRKPSAKYASCRAAAIRVAELSDELAGRCRRKAEVRVGEHNVRSVPSRLADLSHRALRIGLDLQRSLLVVLRPLVENEGEGSVGRGDQCKVMIFMPTNHLSQLEQHLSDNRVRDAQCLDTRLRRRHHFRLLVRHGHILTDGRSDIIGWSRST